MALEETEFGLEYSPEHYYCKKEDCECEDGLEWAYPQEFRHRVEKPSVQEGQKSKKALVIFGKAVCSLCGQEWKMVGSIRRSD